MKNLIFITTYIGSGVTDGSFIDQRINILQYSTIPSVLAQLAKNFVWCIYLDELNIPKTKLNELVKLFELYAKHIKIHICKHKPILPNGSLCVDGRARSCPIKRYELYLESVEFCRKKGYLTNDVQYITHLMLDDDDPILMNHCRWINTKVDMFASKLNENKGVIVINRSQYIFYFDHMRLVSIESTKSMKGSCFIFYSVNMIENIKFHPYSILETIENNGAYKDKYNIGCEIVTDNPTWVYFRHHLSTSGYVKSFLVDKQKSVINGDIDIVRILDFYKGEKLMELVDSLKFQKKSNDIVNWKVYRGTEKKKLIFVIDNLKVYDNALKFNTFIKNNFSVKIISCDNSLPIDNSHVQVSKDDVVSDIKKLDFDYVIVFGDPNIETSLKKRKYLCDNVYTEDDKHSVMGMDVKHVSNWKQGEFLSLYNRMIDVLHGVNELGQMNGQVK